MHGCLSYLISTHFVRLKKSKQCGISAERDGRLGKAQQRAPRHPPEQGEQRWREACWVQPGPGSTRSPADSVTCSGESSSPHASYLQGLDFVSELGAQLNCVRAGRGRGRASPWMWGALCSALLRPQSRGPAAGILRVARGAIARRGEERSRGLSAGWGSHTPRGRKSGSVFSV